MRDKSRALTGTQGPARPVRDRAERKALHGDRHGTTTPAALPLTLRKPVLGERPSVPMRAQLNELAVWQQDKTGGTRLHISLPLDWRVGDKAGQSEPSNDAGLFGRRSFNWSW
jgi:beta-lactamase class A